MFKEQSLRLNIPENINGFDLTGTKFTKWSGSENVVRLQFCQKIQTGDDIK